MQIALERLRSRLAVAAGVLALGAGLVVALPANIAGAQTNVLQDPGFETPNPAGTYFVDCSGVVPCGPSDQVAATGWSAMDEATGSGAEWLQNDLLPSTAPDGGRYMLHVTGDGGIYQSGTFAPLDSADWYAWVEPLVGAVAVCVSPNGHPAGQPLSCGVDAKLGVWTKVSGIYVGGTDPATEMTIGACAPGSPVSATVTCPTASQLVPPLGADAPYGDFYVDNASVVAGLQWSTPSSIDPGNGLESISCPTATFCAAVDNAGHIITTTDGWATHRTKTIDAGNLLSSVSCVSSTFCMAVDGMGKGIKYDSVTQSASSSTFDPHRGLNAVSCKTPSFCAAVDGNGGAFTWTGSWSGATQLDSPLGGLSSISCPSTTYCAVTDNDGNYFQNVNGNWDVNPDDVDGTDFITSVSCPSTGFCAAVDYDGMGLISNGDATNPPNWSQPGPIDGELRSVSCTSPTFCAAVSASGYTLGTVYLYDGSAWTAVNPDVDTVHLPDAISCPTTSFCALVDDGGDVITGRA